MFKYYSFKNNMIKIIYSNSQSNYCEINLINKQILVWKIVVQIIFNIISLINNVEIEYNFHLIKFNLIDKDCIISISNEEIFMKIKVILQLIKPFQKNDYNKYDYKFELEIFSTSFIERKKLSIKMRLNKEIETIEAKRKKKRN